MDGAPRRYGNHPRFLHLKSALLAMETPNCVISLARNAGCGSLTEDMQSIILEIADSLAESTSKLDDIYIKGILKKLITDAESRGEVVIEGAYERYAHYMSSIQENNTSKLTRRIFKHISFLFSEGTYGSWPLAKDFVVPIRCSLNMLEGDTGCAIWPSSLFLSEFILSHPDLFCNKTCLEVGSGAGLVGIALHKVNASKVILTDGDPSSLTNLKFNLKLNGVCIEEDESDWEASSDLLSNPVLCKYMPWEEANETELQDLQPDIVLGADVIYNPSCVPHLVCLIKILLSKKQSLCHEEGHDGTRNCGACCDVKYNSSSSAPVAYIAGVIRNIHTFNTFLKLIEEAHLSAVDITESNKPFCFLPYMLSYDRSQVRLYKVTTCN